MSHVTIVINMKQESQRFQFIHLPVQTFEFQ